MIVNTSKRGDSFLLNFIQFFFKFFFFTWLCRVLVAACTIFDLRCSVGMWDLVPSMDGAQLTCIGSAGSQPLDYQGSPKGVILTTHTSC